MMYYNLLQQVTTPYEKDMIIHELLKENKELRRSRFHLTRENKLFREELENFSDLEEKLRCMISKLYKEKNVTRLK